MSLSLTSCLQVRCPFGQARKSVAIYYVSNARPNATPRYKAAFRPRPRLSAADVEALEAQRRAAEGVGEEQSGSDGGYLELCRLRDSRLLKPEDMQRHTPGWRARWAAEHQEPRLR
jgi:hypothetical protein